jgi:hypothetical protein
VALVNSNAAMPIAQGIQTAAALRLLSLIIPHFLLFRGRWGPLRGAAQDGRCYGSRRFSNSREVSSGVQCGVFSRKTPLEGCGFALHQLENRYDLPFFLVVADFGVDLPDIIPGEQSVRATVPLQGFHRATMGREIKRFPDRWGRFFGAS